MWSGNRVSSSLSKASFIFLAPSIARFHLGRVSVTGQSKSPSQRRIRRMATGDPSSSPASITGSEATNAASSSSTSDTAARSSSAIDFLSLCTRLKTTKRAGWVRRDVKDPESISDHMYRMGLMGLVVSDIPGVDRDKCIKMAIVHDIAEAVVGDITPADGISKEEKSRREREALHHMCQVLGGGTRANEIAELWTEYEENASPEAKVVKDFDKVEMILQALEYENEQGKDLDEFFQSTIGKFQTDIGKAWASEIASRRRKQNKP